MTSTGKLNLSRNLKQMKFMQKKYGAENAALEEEELRSKVDDDHWVLDLPDLTAKESKYSLEHSFVPFEDLQFGRFSYKGMNPVIESMMLNIKAEEETAQCEAREKELAVTDEEMANRYVTLVGTMAKKFSAKRNRTNTMEEAPQKKMKFMRPSDDS